MVERQFVVAAFALLLAACGPVGGDSYESYARGELQAFEFHSSPIAAGEGTFTAAGGNEVSLADFEGRVVLLNIWATWCAPCIHEMPQLDTLERELGGEEFTVLAVSTDRSLWDEVEFFLREEIGAEAIPLFMDTDLDFTLNSQVSVWPTTILYDRDGQELGRLAAPAEWDSADARRMIEAVIEGTRE